MNRAFLLLPILLVLSSGSPLAQSARRFEIGAQGTLLNLSAVDTAFPGLGARAGIHLTDRVALEGEINFFPTARHDVLRGGRKLQLLAGPTLRRSGGAVGTFVKARPGFVRFGEGQGRGVCILIYPPPEACFTSLTMAAIDLGGGFEVPLAARSAFRLDLGDLIVRQPRHSFLPDGPGVRHNLQVAAGVAWTVW